MLTKFESYETEELLKKLRHRNIELGCVDTLGVEIEKRLEDLLDNEDEIIRLTEREIELENRLENSEEETETAKARIEELEAVVGLLEQTLIDNCIEVPEE
jgi:DNA repair exonuclease SbcCD ATPase subunit